MTLTYRSIGHIFDDLFRLQLKVQEAEVNVSHDDSQLKVSLSVASIKIPPINHAALCFYIEDTILVYELDQALKVSEWLLPDTAPYTTAGDSCTPIRPGLRYITFFAAANLKMRSKGDGMTVFESSNEFRLTYKLRTKII